MTTELTIEEVISLWNQRIQGVDFIQMDYTNSRGEFSSYLINIRANKYECLGYDKQILQDLSFDDPILEDAREALLKPLLFPKRTETSSGVYNDYENVAYALKYRGDKFYLQGMLEAKEVIIEAPKERKSSPLTEAKNWIKESYLKSDKFRNFIIDPKRIIEAVKDGKILYL